MQKRIINEGRSLEVLADWLYILLKDPYLPCRTSRKHPHIAEIILQEDSGTCLVAFLSLDVKREIVLKSIYRKDK